ncbi:alpha/beta fold hydrolase [Streptomyces sp. DH12]|uniref:alpha/beta fold hydrolase n=1 Tax=Streptomyces sp. DH12 TaxID=2857010 RepID=UPI001E43AC2E|nr:alpha/beta fold hydrolase [Streptomyces sp. DH12]
MPIRWSATPAYAPSPGRGRKRPRPAWTAAVAGAVCVVTVSSGAFATQPATTPPAVDAVSPRPADHRITTEPGVALSATVHVPRRAAAGERPPLLVMPGTWAFGKAPYNTEARHYADAGYLVVTYSPRGWGASTGRIDSAGPRDVHDLSSVITWAGRRLGVDLRRVGVLGYSYGAGIGLLGAASDPRIDAVAAMDGWADLEDTFFRHDTPAAFKASTQHGFARLLGKPSDEMVEMKRALFSGRVPEHVRAWARQRSPQQYVAALNAHRTAVFLVNHWTDTLLAPPDQIGHLFDSLDGPRHLEMRPGEHAEHGIYCLTGVRIDVCRRTQRWLDDHVRDQRTAVEDAAPFLLRPRQGNAEERHADWRSMTARRERSELLHHGPVTIRTGHGAGADTGLPLLSPALDKRGLPPLAVLPLLPRTTTAVWHAAGFTTAPTPLRGTTRVTVPVTPSASTGTFFVYLYEQDALGVGRLISHAPYTFTDRAPGHRFTVTLDMHATAYDVPRGRRLAVVIDTEDLVYRSANPAGARLTFGHPRLSLPLGP